MPESPKEAPAKKLKTTTLDGSREQWSKQGQFLKDLVLAFTSCNIPLEKLKVSADGEKTLLRQFIDKYVTVEGKTPHIPDPVNLRENYLRKVETDGVLKIFASPSIARFIGKQKLRDIIRNGDFYVVLGSDETDDPRPKNSYIVTVEVTLIDKATHSVRSFHIKLDFPTNVNTQELSTLIDKVCCMQPAGDFNLAFFRL